MCENDEYDNIVTHLFLQKALLHNLKCAICFRTAQSNRYATFERIL